MIRAHQYRFATFVTGPANAAALTAAQAAARRPGEFGRLLVITGDVGLGKTHLARAIVNDARTRRPRLRAAYHTSEGLLTTALGPWRAGVSMLARRLAGVDLLVVDDLHLLAGRPGTRAALGAILVASLARCRQIVVTTGHGGAAPEIAGLFGVPPAALVVATLAPPDPATRLRIVQRIARREVIALPPDAARWVAAGFARNVRELEGAVVRLGAYALFTRRPLTCAFAEEVLGGLRREEADAGAAPEEEPEEAPETVPAPEPPAVVGPELLDGIRELGEFARDVGGGRIGEADVRGREVFVPLVARDGERYLLRLGVGAYLAEPLSCAFVDETRQSTRGAWPFPADGGPFRSPSFICTPPIAEFYEWHRDRVYRPEDGTLTNTVAAVFAALHAPEYAGRFTPGRRAP